MIFPSANRLRVIPVSSGRFAVKTPPSVPQLESRGQSSAARRCRRRSQLFYGDVKVWKCQAVQRGADLNRLRTEHDIGDEAIWFT